MERLTFASKVDTWLAVVIVVAAALGTVATAWVVQRGAVMQAIAAVVLIGLPGVALPLWVLARTGYTLTDDELLVHSGPFRWRVPLREVHATLPSRSWLSSPALSLQRLRIDYGRGRCLLVSPQEEQLFLKALTARCPNLAISGSTGHR